MSKTLTLNKGDDERTKIGGAQDVRGDRGANEADERDGSGLFSEDDYERFLEDEFTDAALPNAPPIPGYHLLWGTTASQYDSVQRRQRMGYEPVRQSELPGFDASRGQALAGYDGFVTCNEMILFKIQEAKYQVMMNFFHHKKPLQEEEGIVGKFNQQGERLGDSDDGVTDMERDMARIRNKIQTFS